MAATTNETRLAPQNLSSLVLIATASILMDRIVRHDRVLERLQGQIALWLALALCLFHYEPQNLPPEESLFQGWLHGVFFANVCSIFAQAQDNSGASSRRTSSRGGASPCVVVMQRWRHVVELLSLATWVAMVSSALAVSLDSWQLNYHDGMLWTFQVFVISLATLWGIQWHVQRKARIAKEVQAIPSARAATNNPGNVFYGESSTTSLLDPSQWCTWNVSQTWHWISKELDKMEDEDDALVVLQLLAPQRIRGNVLDTLTTRQLVQTLGVPYGPAVYLSQSIERLTQQYPRPRTAQNYSAVSSAGGDTELLDRQADWLTLHDQEYNSSTRSQLPFPLYASTTLDNHGRAPSNHLPLEQQQQQRTPPPLVPSLDPDQEERIAKLMKERYGLELPTMRTIANHKSGEQVGVGMESEFGANDGRTRLAPTISSVPESGQTAPNSSVASDSMASGQQGHDPLHTLHGPPALSSQQQGSQHSTIPPALLAQMPPNIREIANRRPDLVQQLLVHKQQQLMQQGKIANPSIAMIPEEEDQLDSLVDDETTSLIQRRPHSRYKSTDGSAI